MGRVGLVDGEAKLLQALPHDAEGASAGNREHLPGHAGCHAAAWRLLVEPFQGFDEVPKYWAGSTPARTTRIERGASSAQAPTRAYGGDTSGLTPKDTCASESSGDDARESGRRQRASTLTINPAGLTADPTTAPTSLAKTAGSTAPTSLSKDGGGAAGRLPPRTASANATAAQFMASPRDPSEHLPPYLKRVPPDVTRLPRLPSASASPRAQLRHRGRRTESGESGAFRSRGAVPKA